MVLLTTAESRVSTQLLSFSTERYKGNQLRPIAFLVVSICSISGLTCSTAYCNPSTCHGCCDATADKCISGTASTACGSGGLACMRCEAGDECRDGGCRKAACKDGGGRCVAFSDCCSQSCTDEICDPVVCDSTGVPCSLKDGVPGRGTCCSETDTCYAGTCRACRATFSNCLGSTECCSGRCAQGICAETCDEGIGVTCGSCCAGLECVDSTETNRCAGNPLSCHCGPFRCIEAGRACGRTSLAAPCCAGLACVSGVCR